MIKSRRKFRLIAAAALSSLTVFASTTAANAQFTTSKISPVIGTQPKLTFPEVSEISIEEASFEENVPANFVRTRFGHAKLVNLPANAIVRLYSPNEYPDSTASSKLRSPALDPGVFCSGRFGPRGTSGAPAETRASSTGIAEFDFSVSTSVNSGGTQSADGDGPCQGNLGIEIIVSGQAPKYFQPKTPVFDLPRLPIYTYTNTKNLKNWFNFKMLAEGLSTCSGKSIGPSTYNVGPTTISNDLAITIRSGPAGTTCRAVAPGVLLPKDVRIRKIVWEVRKITPTGQTNKCCFGDACLPIVGESAILAPGHLPDNTASTYQDGGFSAEFERVFHTNQPTPVFGEHLLGYAHAWMACEKTATNDHGITLILKSAEIEAPTGFPVPAR